MQCEGKLKLKSRNTSYCLIEVVTKTGLPLHSILIKQIGGFLWVLRFLHK